MPCCLTSPNHHQKSRTNVNTLRPRQHGRHFADDTLKRIFLNENAGISIKISFKFLHKCPINNIPALVQIMAWRRPGDKPLSEPMVGILLTHICVTRPQWVNLHLWGPLAFIPDYYYLNTLKTSIQVVFKIYIFEIIGHGGTTSSDFKKIWLPIKHDF